jgi:hypothetical protein
MSDEGATRLNVSNDAMVKMFVGSSLSLFRKIQRSDYYLLLSNLKFDYGTI